MVGLHHGYESRSKGNSRIRLFPTVRAMLDGMVGALPENERDRRRLRAHLAHMSSEYRSLRTPVIPYESPACRVAYVYNNVAIHAAIIEQAILKYPDAVFEPLRSRFEEKGTLRVCAFGGGPATEALALMRLFQDHPPDHRSPELAVKVLDRVSMLGDAFEFMVEAIEPYRAAHGVRLNLNFQTFDMTDLAYWGGAQTLRRNDLVILNYVVSELFEQSELLKLREAIDFMAAGASQGAKLVVIDHKAAGEKVTQLVSGTAWGHVYHGEERVTIPSEEDKSALGAYLDAFGRPPRLRAMTFKLVATKR
jgi:hypothetical protein